LNVNAVKDHLSGHPGDLLGQCGQNPCSQELLLVNNDKNSNQFENKENLKVSVLPNPSISFFNLKIESNSSMPVSIRVIDVYGREISRTGNLQINNYFKLGNELKAGLYFAEIIQGDQRKVLKLIKL